MKSVIRLNHASLIDCGYCTGIPWEQAAEPYSEHWNKVMDELLELDFTLDPTFNIYEASRDLHRARRAEWHEAYPYLPFGNFINPMISHGSY